MSFFNRKTPGARTPKTNPGRHGSVAPLVQVQPKPVMPRPPVPKVPTRDRVDPFAIKLKLVPGPLVPTNKIRAIKGSPTNIRVDTRMKDWVDKLYTLLPSYRQIASLRQALSGQSSFPRKHLDTIKGSSESDLLSAKTNYGSVCMSQVFTSCPTSLSMEYALEQMGIDEDDIEDCWETKHKLCVETGQMKMDVLDEMEPFNKQLQDLIDNFKLFESEKYTEEERNLIRWVACRQYQKQILQKKAAQYIKTFNKLKELFANHSTTGNFPRRWRYRGVSMGWDKCGSGMGFAQRARWYLMGKDTKEGATLYQTFQNNLIKYNKTIEKYTYRYCIDGFDYRMPDSTVIAI